MTLIFWIVGGLALLIFTSTANALFKVRLYPTRSAREIGWDEVPPEIIEQMRPAVETLQTKGFSPETCLDWNDNSNGVSPVPRILMVDSSRRIGAAVVYKSIRGIPTVHVMMFSCPEDSLTVVTCNVPAFDMGKSDELDVLDEAFPTATQQMESHVEMVRKHCELPLELRPGELSSRYLGFSDSYLQRLEAKKRLASDTSGPVQQYRLTTLGVLTNVFLVVAYSFSAKGKRLMNNWSSPNASLLPPGGPPPLPEISTLTTANSTDPTSGLSLEDSIDYRNYLAQKASTESGKSSGIGRKTFWFVATLIISIVALKWIGALDLAEAVSIVVILLIHEMGHALTMKTFGYRNLSIFFIPMLGAAAAGKKEMVPAWQEFWVLLMGPLPGLVAGAAILIAGFFAPDLPDWLLDAAFLSIIINAFNLLPFTPLDGGRILDLLVFRRIPKLRVFFLGFTALCCVIFGVLISSTILMIIGGIQFLGLASVHRASKLVRIVRSEISSENTTRDKVVKTIRSARLHGSAAIFQKPNWALHIDNLIEWAVARRMGLIGTFSALILYGGLLLTPLFATIAVYALIYGNEPDHYAELLEKQEIAAGWRNDMLAPETPTSSTSPANLELLEKLSVSEALFPYMDGRFGGDCYFRRSNSAGNRRIDYHNRVERHDGLAVSKSQRCQHHPGSRRFLPSGSDPKLAR